MKSASKKTEEGAEKKSESESRPTHKGVSEPGMGHMQGGGHGGSR